MKNNSIAEAAFLAEGRMSVSNFDQAGLNVSRHPFIWSDNGPDLMVVEVDRDYDSIAESREQVRRSGDDDPSPLARIIEESDAPIAHDWLRTLGRLGIGGIYRRIYVDGATAGATGDALITEPALVRKVHQAGQEELLSLLSTTSWPPADETANPISSARLSAIMRCEDAGSEWEEIVDQVGGREWHWLRKATDSSRPTLSDYGRQAIWSACKAESQTMHPDS